MNLWILPEAERLDDESEYEHIEMKTNRLGKSVALIYEQSQRYVFEEMFEQ